MATRERGTFGRMCRTFPVRTGLFTAGPVILGFLQLLNWALNGGSALLGLVPFAVTVAFAVLVTRFHLASFRVDDLTGRVDGGSAAAGGSTDDDESDAGGQF